DGDFEDMGKQCKLQSNGIASLAIRELLVTVRRGYVRRYGYQAVCSERSAQSPGFDPLSLLSALLFGRRNISQVTIDGSVQGHPFRWRAPLKDAAGHFIFGSPRPILGIALGAPGLRG